MIWQLIIAGFGLGLMSGLHCIGMCGPIAMGIPVFHLSPLERTTSILAYNVGRTITYSLLGLVIGSFSQTVSFAGYQQFFSVIIGVFILFTVCLSYLGKRNLQPAIFVPFQNWLGRLIARLMHSKSSALAVGMANGLLPCGMVYLALAAALNYGSAIEGTFFMTMFGIGTIPLMLSFSVFGLQISVRLRNQLKKRLPILSAVVAVLFIVRGLGLGIQGLSPRLELVFQQISHCF